MVRVSVEQREPDIDIDLEERIDELELQTAIQDSRLDSLMRHLETLEGVVLGAVESSDAYDREPIEDVVDDLKQRLRAVESAVDTDLDGKAYGELTRKDKVRQIQTALINEATGSPTDKAAMDYQEIRWLFNGQPSTGHVYDLMDFAGQEDGFDYDRRDGKNNRLTVDLDAVKDELQVHAVNDQDH